MAAGGARRSRPVRALLLAALLLAGALAGAAAAPAPAPAADGAVQNLTRVATFEERPAGYVRTAGEVRDAALRAPRIRRTLRRNPGATVTVFLKGPGRGRWQVSWFQAPRRGVKQRREIAVAYVDDASGRVTEAWTGHQVAWTMARGYPGAFGRKANALWIWLPLTALFVLPFVQWRRPGRGPAKDLAAVALFGVPLAFFEHADIGLSVPLAYPLLVYLLARLLWIGLRTRDGPGGDPAAARPLPLLVPVRWLLVGLLFLVGFRAGLDVADGNVIDVGYAGVLGADKLADGAQLWGAFPPDNAHGDTYGPMTYLAYVPFEQLLPWSGSWDDLAAARAFAIVTDLGCMALLFLLGRRMRGAGLGIVLAYAWAACPFTLFALASNSNDAFVGMLVLGALLAAQRPAARGILVGLAGWAKFAPLALAPLLATAGTGDGIPARRRRALRFAAGLLLVTVLSAALVLAHGDLRTFYDRTLAYQSGRESPFSIWGLWGGRWGTVQAVVQAAGVLLAVAVAVLPRRRDVVGLAALSGAVLLGLQLGVTHWFYLYLAWVLGPLLVAVLGRYGSSTWSIESARSGAEARTTTALSQGSSSDGSKRTDIWVRRLSMACSRTTPRTPPRAPVMPTSVT